MQHTDHRGSKATNHSRPIKNQQTSRLDFDAHKAGLTLLARRELSAAQLRTRLLQKTMEPKAIELAILRLKKEGALDDHRMAMAYTRQSINLKQRGPNRVAQELEARGVDRGTALSAIKAVFTDYDTKAVLEHALKRRLTGSITNRSEFRRLYQYLIRQGFDPDLIVNTLRTKSRSTTLPSKAESEN